MGATTDTSACQRPVICIGGLAIRSVVACGVASPRLTSSSATVSSSRVLAPASDCSGGLAGLLAQTNGGGDGLHQQPWLGTICPLQSQPLADQGLQSGWGLLYLDPDPIPCRGGRRGRLLWCRQDQSADPFGAGAIKISARLWLERVALGPAPDRAAGEGLAALRQRMAGCANAGRRLGAGRDKRRRQSLDQA